MQWNEEKEKWNEEKKRLSDRLRDSEMTLVMVADQKQQLAEKNKKMFEEKRGMLDRQCELEMMLKDAVEGKAVEEDKENSKKISPKKSITASSRPRVSSRSRAPPRPKQPLSPTGSVGAQPRFPSRLRQVQSGGGASLRDSSVG